MGHSPRSIISRPVQVRFRPVSYSLRTATCTGEPASLKRFSESLRKEPSVNSTHSLEAVFLKLATAMVHFRRGRSFKPATATSMGRRQGAAFTDGEPYSE